MSRVESRAATSWRRGGRKGGHGVDDLIRKEELKLV